ncbi:MAG: HD domain-containing protein [Verrucomicrobium sp.]|nr:HD domain-containing protein [Verrucomicrobium sp.]
MTFRELLLAAPADGTEWSGGLACQVAAARPGTTKTGKPYLELELADGTGAERIKLWSDAPAYEEAQGLRPGAFLWVEAVFRRNGFGLNPDRLHFRPLSEEESAALLAGTPERRDFLAGELAYIEEAAASLADPRLRVLCQVFFSQYGERFARAAAARDFHHARRGGLVEHVAQMLRGAAALAPVYPRLNWDLVRAGVLFHDCGKLWENDYAAEGFVMPYTQIGELLGHIPVGMELVNALWRTVAEREEFTQAATPSAEQVKLHLLHLIASHHGQREFGAPVTPRTPEAWALHYLDNLDAKLEMLRSAYEEKAEIAPGIFDRRPPLEGRPVRSLAAYVPPAA